MEYRISRVESDKDSKKQNKSYKRGNIFFKSALIELFTVTYF